MFRFDLAALFFALLIFFQSSSIAAISPSQSSAKYNQTDLLKLIDNQLKQNLLSIYLEQLLQQEQALLSQIDYYIDKLNYSEALETANIAVTEFPERILFRYLKVQTLMELNQYKQAKRELSEILQHHPDDYFTHYLFIKLLIRQGKISAALQAIESGSKTTSTTFKDLLAWAYLLKAEPFLAKAEIKTMFNVYSNQNIFALSVLHEACKQTGDAVCIERIQERFAQLNKQTDDETVKNVADSDLTGIDKHKIQPAENFELVRQPLDILLEFQKLSAAGKIDDAIELGNQLIAGFPNNPLSYLTKIQLAITAKYFDVAHQTLDLMNKNIPEYLEWHEVRAKIFIQQGKNTRALQSYQQLMQQKPEISSPVEQYGELLIQTGQFAKAVTFYLQNLERFPNAYWLRLRLAKAYRDQLFYQQAETAYKKAIMIFPDRVIAYNGLAQTIYRQKKYTQASEIYHQSLTIKAKNFEALSGLAYIFIKQKKLDMAEEYARKSILAFPENPLPYSTLANVLFLKGKKDEARATCTKLKSHIREPYDYYTLNECYNVIEQLPEALKIAQKIYQTQATPIAIKNLAYMHYRNQNWLDAVNLYQQISENYMTDVLLLNYYAFSLSQLNRFQDALNIYQQILKIEPNNANNLANTALSLYEMKNLQKALKVYLQVLHIEPGNANALISTAMIYRDLKQMTKADEWFNKSFQTNPNDQGTVATYAEHLYLSKKYTEAIEFSNNQLKVFANHVELLNTAFSSAIMLGNIDLASDYFNRLLSSQQANADNYYFMGLLYVQSQKMVNGLPLLEKAVELSPENIQYYSDLGYAYFSQKMLEKALLTYQKGLSLPEAYKNGLLNYNYSLALHSAGQFKQSLEALHNANKAGYSGSPRFKAILDRALRANLY